MNITTGSVLKYSFLPGILPRAGKLFFSGFSHLSFFVAHVFGMARLLPAGHPYLNPDNFGRYGLRHVMAEAHNRLVFKRENIDQIIIFYALLAGIAIVFLQFLLFFVAMLLPSAQAGSLGAYYAAFFVTQFPEGDLAFILLDRVFGMPDIYNSRVALGAEGPFPAPFHMGLHALFEFYNIGILAVGLIVFLYFVTTVVAETAQTGTPFGKRFTHAWAPVRMMLAVALLLPLVNGMNGAQLLTLYVAKWGSGLATNSWNLYLNTVTGRGETPMGNRINLVGQPNVPPMTNLMQFMFTAQTCAYTEYHLNRRLIKAYIVRKDKPPVIFGESHIFSSPANGTTSPYSYADAIEYADKDNIEIVFGEYQNPDYNHFTSFVRPVCGQVSINTNNLRRDGAHYVQERYYHFIYTLWDDSLNWFYATNIAKNHGVGEEKDPDARSPDRAYIQATADYFKNLMTVGPPPVVEEAVRREVNSLFWNVSFRQYGWGGAAIWYNKIAEINGGLVESVMNTPTPKLYPEIMEQVLERRQAKDMYVYGPEKFSPKMSDSTPVELQVNNGSTMASTYYEAFSAWNDAYEEPPKTNIFVSSIAAVFGVQGLFNIRKNSNVNPLAQLSQVGKGLIESSIAAFGFSIGGKILGGLAGLQGENIGSTVGNAMSSIAGKIGMFGLMLGFVLFYVLPALPFVYFFFAVGGWVKGLFEAMVGLPLWALAHIRIDGNGIPGKAAMGGYYLIFEVLIRPVLILFSLLGGLVIFTAQVQVLNEIFDLVVQNLTGVDRVTPGATMAANIRGYVDQFFYTIVYTIVVYMMGTASFKLIDIIPDNILRFLGASVASFGNIAEDPGKGLMGRIYFGGQAILGQMNVGIANLLTRNG